ncbi:DUF4011 domain-containing protein [Nocardioides sp. GY 10127]|uniref:DUF4011 domain-containing protein n=1 Tax=Nocardioides sp. GY 10127 TaxID=2569762 RepID=UPI00145824F9|nr:DUF4011 domain-containing protein [Nocardioides sp. GY 10127]
MSSPVSLDVRTSGFLSYALAHNGAPFLDVSVTNAGAPLVGAVLVVGVADAEGPLSDVARLSLDLPTGTVATPARAHVRLDPAALLQVDERRPGTVRVSLQHEGRQLVSVDEAVTVLAPRQWLRVGRDLSMEMLAAHVQPNDPAVEELLAEASEILQQRTGSGSVQGYQSGPERARLIVDAVLDAAVARDIHYTNPPASWHEKGQKVRTPAEVLEGRAGTCLDTTTTLAAALEQAGLFPQMWVVQGHAFLSWSTEEVSLERTVTTDLNLVTNLVDTGRLRLVETTLVPGGGPVDWQAAHERTRRKWLVERRDDVLAVVDVVAARRNGIVPLPARRVQQDGAVTVHEYHAGQHSTAIQLPTSRRRPAQDATNVPRRVQTWKSALLDLTLRNRLLSYKPASGLALRVPDGRLADLEDLVHAEVPVTLAARDALDEVHLARGLGNAFDLPDHVLSEELSRHRVLHVDLSSEAYQKTLASLANKARTGVEQTGANNLYLALGMLHWTYRDPNGTASSTRDLSSPLILVPVRLVARDRGRTYQVVVDDSGLSTPNYCLFEKLKQDMGVDLTGLSQLEADEHGVDVSGAFQRVREQLLEAGMDARVEESAQLAHLDFAKYRLWKDLDDHWEQLLENRLVRHLVETPTEAFEDAVPADRQVGDLDALDALCPIPADASQLEAVEAAVAGETFVLEGPPGTGKSQTITNLLARAVASGKRVLFVAEKRAALDVVSARLRSVGLEPFCLDLHDKGAKPAEVRSQLRAALAHEVLLDAEGLETDRDDLRAARGSLLRYHERLHERNLAGLSYYAAREKQLSRGEDELTLQVPRSLLTQPPAVHDVLREAIRSVAETDPGHPVRRAWGFVTRVDTSETTCGPLVRAAAELDAATAALGADAELARLVGSAGGSAEVRSLAWLLSHGLTDPALLATTQDVAWQTTRADLLRALESFAGTSLPGTERTTPDVLGLPLEELHARAVEAAESSIFGRGKRLSAVLEDLAPVLVPAAEVRPKELPALLASLVNAQHAAREIAARASALPGIVLPEGWNPLRGEDLASVRERAELLHQGGAWLASDDGFCLAAREWLGRLQSGAATVPDDVAARLVALAEAVEHLVAEAGPGAELEVERWRGEEGLLDRWTTTSPGRGQGQPEPQTLVRWTAFLAAIDPLRQHGVADTWRLLREQGDVEGATHGWERGLAQVSLVERAQATGIDGFDAARHERSVAQFSRSTAKVRQHLRDVLPHDVKKARPFDPERARGRVGELSYQLGLSRGGLGVRALMEQFGDLVTQVMPCVLVSPDSVARFFPVGGTTFDLVVFDEASQVRVADAVGAMGRGRAVVVVGDSKQMPPTQVGVSAVQDASLEDEEPDEVDGDEGPVVSRAPAEQESILSEAVAARVRRRTLTWHYRSQDESLIAFSNALYYGDELSTFPSPTTPATAATRGLGISLRKVDGTFLRSGKGAALRTNPVEAEAIVAEVLDRFSDSPDEVPSVGVVTFNAQQRALVEQLLREAADERVAEALDAPDGLFVKNLENVQGDERDVILFSTAFSVNEKGVLPGNFGPLSRAGGERRLNVAITRARKQVVLFTSFDPGQMPVKEGSYQGMRDLQSYLELAARGAESWQAGKGFERRQTDRHRDDVADALRARGLVVRTDVGLSDFRVDLALSHAEAPDELLVAVLLDGDKWAARRTVGDRDGLPVEVLRNLMGWPGVERVWLPTWLQDREGALDRLVDAVEHARGGEPLPADEPQPVDEEVALVQAATSGDTGALAALEDLVDAAIERIAHEAPPVPLAPAPERAPSDLPGQVSWRPFEPRAEGDREVLDSLPSRWASLLVEGVARDVLEAEGPVQAERLARLVAASFDLGRVSAKRQAAILAVAPGRVDEDGFVWPRDLDREHWADFALPGPGGSRPVAQVSLRELGNAMVALCAVSAGVRTSDLPLEVLRLFGGTRMTPAASARLEAGVAHAVAHGRLKEDASGYLHAT